MDPKKIFEVYHLIAALIVCAVLSGIGGIVLSLKKKKRSAARWEIGNYLLIWGISAAISFTIIFIVLHSGLSLLGCSILGAAVFGIIFLSFLIPLRRNLMRELNCTKAELEAKKAALDAKIKKIAQDVQKAASFDPHDKEGGC